MLQEGTVFLFFTPHCCSRSQAAAHAELIILDILPRVLDGLVQAGEMLDEDVDGMTAGVWASAVALRAQLEAYTEVLSDRDQQVRWPTPHGSARAPRMRQPAHRAPQRTSTARAPRTSSQPAARGALHGAPAAIALPAALLVLCGHAVQPHARAARACSSASSTWRARPTRSRAPCCLLR